MINLLCLYDGRFTRFVWVGLFFVLLDEYTNDGDNVNELFVCVRLMLKASC